MDNIGYSVKVGDMVATIIDSEICSDESFDVIWRIGDKLRITGSPSASNGRLIWLPDEAAITRIFNDFSQTYIADQLVKDGKIFYDN